MENSSQIVEKRRLQKTRYHNKSKSLDGWSVLLLVMLVVILVVAILDLL